MHPSRSLLRAAALAAALITPSAARAATAPPAEPAPVAPAAVAPAPDAIPPARASDPWGAARRPWIFAAADPSAPRPGHVLASLAAGYAQVDLGAGRPFAGNVAHAGGVFSAGAEVGVLRFASVRAEGLLAGESGKVNAGAMIGASFYPLATTNLPVGVELSGGWLRELGGDNGVWFRTSVGGEIGHLRLVLTALGEHVFPPADSPPRDDIDILLTTGASYAVLPYLRLGAEYVVQDLEGAWDEEEAEGGVRHFLGPTASLQLGPRVLLGAGPAFGLSKESPRLLGRLAATYAF